MRFGSTAKVLLKCKLKYYTISECGRGPREKAEDRSPFPKTLSQAIAILPGAAHVMARPQSLFTESKEKSQGSAGEGGWGVPASCRADDGGISSFLAWRELPSAGVLQPGDAVFRLNLQGSLQLTCVMQNGLGTDLLP